MNLISLPWAAVTDGALIVGPSGRVWVADRRVPGPGRETLTIFLRDPETSESQLVVSHVTTTTAVIQPADHTRRAIDILTAFFPSLEMIGV